MVANQASSLRPSGPPKDSVNCTAALRPRRRLTFSESSIDLRAGGGTQAQRDASVVGSGAAW